MTVSRVPQARVAYSIEEAAEQLSIGRTYMRDLIARGEIKARRSGKRVLIAHSDLVAYVAALPEVGAA